MRTPTQLVLPRGLPPQRNESTRVAEAGQLEQQWRLNGATRVREQLRVPVDLREQSRARRECVERAGIGLVAIREEEVLHLPLIARGTQPEAGRQARRKRQR